MSDDDVDNDDDDGRSLAAAAGWVKTILSADQKKTDFNPQGGEALPVASGACLRVVRWIYHHIII